MLERWKPVSSSLCRVKLSFMLRPLAVRLQLFVYWRRERGVYIISSGPLDLFLRLYSGNNLDELICTVPMSESGLVNELARREYIRCNIMKLFSKCKLLVRS